MYIYNILKITKLQNKTTVQYYIFMSFQSLKNIIEHSTNILVNTNILFIYINIQFKIKFCNYI